MAGMTIGKWAIGTTTHTSTTRLYRFPAAVGTFLFVSAGGTANQRIQHVSYGAAYLYTGFQSVWGLTLLASTGAFVLTGMSNIIARVTGVSYINSRLVQPYLSRLRKVAPALTNFGASVASLTRLRKTPPRLRD